MSEEEYENIKREAEAEFVEFCKDHPEIQTRLIRYSVAVSDVTA